MTFATALGVAAFMLMIAGVITGNTLVFTLLATDIVLLWLATTVRHAFVA